MKNIKFLNIGFKIALVAGFIAIGAIAVNNLSNRYGENHELREVAYLNTKGFTDVKITGKKYWCPKGTSLSAEFEAKDIIAQKIKGHFCKHGSIEGASTISVKPKM